VITTLSPSFDFFMYYFTLFITPMILACGVFFPVEQLPDWLQVIARWLPLGHAVALIRPLFFGTPPETPWLHVGMLLMIALGAFWLAVAFARRRFLQ